MLIINDLSDYKQTKKCAVTLGKFDGVHKGHQKLLNIALYKTEEGVISVAFTFIPTDLGNEFITDRKERHGIFERMGIDILLEIPFTKEFASILAKDFVKEILVDKMNAKYIISGPDFRFGKDRLGDTDMLIELSREFGYTAIVEPKELYKDKEISSTYIRNELKLGNIGTVNKLLGYKYGVYAEVIHGKALGRKFKYPTINMIADSAKLLPPNGVYATRVLFDGRVEYGVTNIGVKPTVNEGKIKKGIETYILDFNEDMYGKYVKLEFCWYLREERKYERIEDLFSQIEMDAVAAKEYFKIL